MRTTNSLTGTRQAAAKMTGRPESQVRRRGAAYLELDAEDQATIAGATGKLSAEIRNAGFAVALEILGAIGELFEKDSR